ncbi:hypothetical protein AVEN_259252-1 [Araneus ventricosus]|uniref:C2H2-type domain-containing protein n=1 Tax=Araneus ventricosus TaxID=182803 RepID=A0A4Y2R6Y9_ARAVE|nr:hypothetical protein AVEN_259252-1 [Araneus ventricosus]
MRTHTREKKTHPCEQCDQVFPRMSNLLRHKRTDHSAPPTPRIAAAPRARNSEEGYQVVLCLEDSFQQGDPDGDVVYCTPYFRSKVVIELDTSMIGDHIEQAFEKIKESLDEFLKN